MSDVLIKNMKMPTNCFDCPCYHHKRDDGYYDYEICRASGTVFNDGYSSVTGHKDHINPFEARLDNCPLIPVPPHGRLIDADALLDRFERESKSANEHGRDFTFCFMSNNEPCAEWWAVEQIVEDFITTNTVIEAEEAHDES